MKKSRYNWKMITLGDFERYCKNHPNSTYILDYDQQESSVIDVPSVIYKAYYDSINIMFGPKRVAIMNGRSYFDFLFIKSLYIAEKPTELGQPFMIVCDNPTRTIKDKYIIFQRENSQ